MPTRYRQWLTILSTMEYDREKECSIHEQVFERCDIHQGVLYLVRPLLLLLMINMQTVQNSLLVSITGAALGVFLLIFPVPPHSFQRRYGKERAVHVTRVLAVAIIVISFISKVQF